MTNHSDGDKCKSLHSLVQTTTVTFTWPFFDFPTDEIQFDSSLRVIQGDQFNPVLNDRLSPLFQKKSELYRRLVMNESRDRSPFVKSRHAQHL